MYTDPNPFLQLTMPRVRNAAKTLQSHLWENPLPVEVAFAGAGPHPLPFHEARTRPFTPVQLPFTWGHLFETGWFHLRFPEANSDRPRFLHWHDQGEGTLFLDHEAYYGFDVAHRHVRIPANTTEGWIEGLCLQSAIWHPDATGTTPEGSRLSQASIVHRNDDVWHAIHDLEVLTSLAHEEAKQTNDFAGFQPLEYGFQNNIEIAPVLLRRLLRILDDAVNALDSGGPAAMLNVFDRARPLLEQSPTPARGILTGHAHIDLVWLWPERCGDYKARHTFASMNRLLKEYPEFRFAYSQSASYEAVAKHCPQLFEQVKTRVEEGVWEPVGATYVEMDTLLPCGEALTRAFLTGQQSFQELFGQSSKTLWLPDVFGYAACLPQIMRQCGVRNFFTTKLTWSSLNRFPHSSFIWRGLDGSEVLTHVTQELGYNQNALPDEARLGANANRQIDLHDASLHPTGFGDGGGGVTPEMCERARRMRSLTGVPKMQWGRIDDFFEELEALHEQLPNYQGELYLEYHRGTFTTHGDLKATFRELERALQVQEAAHTLTAAGPIDIHPWKRLIFSQFHDYIPGSSIREVYSEGLPELQSLAESAREHAASQLGKGSAVFNPLPLARPHLHFPDGAPARVTLPPLSAVQPNSLPTFPVSTPTANGLSLQSDRVHAVFNLNGEVTELTIDGFPLAIERPLNEFMVYPDHPHAFPAWDIDRQTLSLGEPLDSPVERISPPAEPGTASLAFRRTLGQNSHLTVFYRLDACHPVLHIEVDLDWQERNTLLKALFPSGYRGRSARFGTPFNSVTRVQQPGNSRDEAMYETSASRWVATLDDSQSEGLHLITENKYGVACREGTLGLSLVRSALLTGEAPSPDRPDRSFPEANRPLQNRDPHSDIGPHHIRYALGRYHQDLPREENPAALADLLYTAPLPAASPKTAGLLELKGGNSLIPAWAKPLPDGAWILRLHETLGRAGTLRLRLEDGWSLARTRLAEDEHTPCDPDAIPFHPFEILSLRLTPPR